jgi:glutamate/aspartate transport system permease protein
MWSQFDWSVIPASLPFLWTGLKFTAHLTFIAMAGGILFGTLLALARLSSIGPLAMVATWYVNLMRSIPLVMVILWFFLVIPLIIGRILQ